MWTEGVLLVLTHCHVTINGDLMVNNGEEWDDNVIYPLVMSTVCELENDPVEIVDLAIDSLHGGSFQFVFLYVYQRVSIDELMISNQQN